MKSKMTIKALILVFAVLALSIASATASEQYEKEETFSELSIKLKAIQVSREIENYILAHPEKTLKDLQDDPDFQKIAVQSVGRTGYTAVTDYDTLTCRFHKNPQMVDTDLHTLSGKLPGFWSIMSKTKGGKEAYGTYDWEEADRSIMKKYMYIAIINTKTADGIGLSVAATTYPGEYDLKPAQDPGNAPPEQQELFQINKISLISIIGILICLFFGMSIEEKEEKEAKNYFRMFLVSVLIIAIMDIIRLNASNPAIVLYASRILFSAHYFFALFFMLIILSTANISIKKSLAYLSGILIAALCIFTDLIFKDTYLISSITGSYPGVLFRPLWLLIFLYVLISLSVLIRRTGNADKSRYFLPVILTALFMVLITITGMLHIRVDLIQVIFPILIVLSLGIALFKANFLKHKKTTPIILLMAILLIMTGLFIFSAYQITENMKSSAVKSYEHQQILIAQQAANSIETYIDFIIANAQVTAQHPDIASPDPEKTLGILERMYDRLAISSKGIVLTRLDRNGTLIAKYTESPEDMKKGIGIHYLKFTGFDSESVAEVMETHHATISKPIRTPCGHDAITILTPIFNQHEFDGILRVTVFIDETFVDEYIKPIHFAESGHVHLIIDNIEFSSQTSRTKENRTLQPTENLPLLEKISTGKPGIIKQKYTHISTGRETDETTITAYYPIKIPGKSWAVVAEMPEKEAYAQIQNNINKIWYSTIAIITALIIIGTIFYILLTRSLRQQIEQKTGQIRNFNIKLENTVKQRTKEVEQKTKELQNLNITLEKQVEKKTKELEQKLVEEEKSSQAMLFILERQKKTNILLKESRQELENKNKELQLHSTKLCTYNTQLQEAEIALKKEKQSVEKKVIERTKELKKEKEQVELLLEQKDRFINQLSHDLRTPLTPMLTVLPVSIKHTKDKDVKYDLKMILRNARYLNSLVVNTLDLARIQANAIIFEKGTVNISQMIKDTMEANKTTYKQYNVNVVNNAKDNIFASADELRTREIIENLVMNSLKFMSDGGTLTFNAAYKSKKEVIISVSDTGIGIEKEKITKIFEEFYKADESRHNLMGTGLGLSICQKLVEKMHGTIWAESKGKNKGTTIYFTLPRHHP